LYLQELVAYQNLNNQGEVNSTNEEHKQHDKETTNKNPNSLAMSQWITQSWMKRRTNGMDTRKTPIGGSNDGGYTNTPRESIEKTHVAYIPIKRKINLS